MSLLKEINAVQPQVSEGLLDNLKKIGNSLLSKNKPAVSSSDEEHSNPALKQTAQNIKDYEQSGHVEADEAHFGAITKMIKSFLGTPQGGKKLVVVYCTFEEAKALILNKSKELLANAQRTTVNEKRNLSLLKMITETDFGGIKDQADHEEHTNDVHDQAAADAKEQPHSNSSHEDWKNGAHGEPYHFSNPDLTVQVLDKFDFAKIKPLLKTSIKKICIYVADPGKGELTKDSLASILVAPNYQITLQAQALKNFSPEDFKSIESLIPKFDVTLGKADPACIVAHFKDKTTLLQGAEEWGNSSYAGNKQHSKDIADTALDAQRSKEKEEAGRTTNAKDEVIKVFLDAVSKTDGQFKPDFVASLVKNNQILSKIGVEGVKNALSGIKKSLNIDLRKQIDLL